MPEYSLAQIAERIGGMVEGDAAIRVSAVQPLASAGPGDLVVLFRRADLRALDDSGVSAAVVPATAPPVRKPVVRVRDARLALAQVLELFYSRPRDVAGIDPRAVIAPDVRIGRDVNVAAGAYIARAAEIGDRVDIYPGVYIGERVRIGDDSVILANVSVYADTVIGKRVRLHSGVVIGSDGFGYTAGPSQELYKIPQIGRVEIDDDVEIGANTTIDRATMTITRIGRGAKIDNLVQIAHNVEIEEHACIVAQCGVAGSARIGSRAVLGAGAGVIDHVEVGAGARVGARAGVHRDVPPGATFIGTPAIPGHLAVRAYALIPQLPEYRRRIKDLEARCARLEAALNESRRS